MIFKAAMTSEYSKMDNIVLSGLHVTNLISGVGLMRKMPKLQELNLSNNKISSL